MSSAQHADRNHGNDEGARVENTAAQLRVPIATIRYWQTHRGVTAD